jgi:hypothetical protein
VTIQIEDKEAIWRRYPRGEHIRAKDLILRPGEEGLSCNLKALTTIEATLEGRAKDRIAEAIVEKVRALGLRVEHKPEENNQAHCEIYPTETADLEDEDFRDRLAEIFNRIHPPPQAVASA